jgi:RHS repeat-associated protein
MRAKIVNNIKRAIQGTLLGALVVTASLSQGQTNSFTWQYGYDAKGRLNSQVDPNNQSTYYYYDSLGRLTRSQQPPNTGTSSPTLIDYGYNPQDALTSVLDPRSITTTYTVTGLSTVTGLASPDSGTSSYTYDAKGNVLTKTDARGKVTTYAYDDIDRLTSISYSTGTATTFEYDGGSSPYAAAAGELTKITDESGQSVYAYDAMGRLTSKTVTIGTKTFTVTYGWGNSGAALDKLTSITYPSGNKVNYSYASNGKISGITVNAVNPNGSGQSGTAQTLVSSIGYSVDARITGWQWSDGKARTIGYDGNGLISSYTLGDPNGTGTAAGALRTLTRDAAGRITGYTHTNSGSPVASLDQSFSYDNLDRLLTHTTSSTSYGFSYDATGNRAAKMIGGTSYTNTVSSSSNKLTQVQDVGGTANPSYDNAGNVTGDGTNTYSYSDRGRMTSATVSGGSVSFTYNGLEQRAKKSSSGSTGYYVYDEAGQLLGEYEANGYPVYETIYLGSTPIGALKQTGTAAGNNIAVAIYNVYADQIDTPRVITQQDHQIVWRWDGAEAFGASAPDQNPNSLGTFAYNQRFPGQVFDSETGLNQNWNREYNARTGRYAQSDPIGLAGGINTYLYVGGRPTSRIDPLGLWSTAAHNYFMQEFAKEMGMAGQYGFMDQMMAGSRFADSSQFQSGEFTYMHAMSSPVWSPQEAKKMMCKYVRAYLDVSRQMINSPYPADWGKGYFYLGMAMHAVMDSTSPAHRGFQFWGGMADSAMHGYGQRHGPLPASEEDFKSAPAFRDETVNLMKRAMASDMGACGCD